MANDDIRKVLGEVASPKGVLAELNKICPNYSSPPV